MRLFIIFLFLALLFIERKYKTKKPYFIALIIYFIFLSLRYMQGTDYYSYYYYYFFERDIFEAFALGYKHSFELLYNLLVSLFKLFDLPFFAFVSFFSGLMLTLYHRFFKAYKIDSVLTIILLYMLYGIIFIESALRQGMAMSILLGIGMVGYKQKDFKQILLGAVFAFLFHRTSIIFSIVCIALYFIFEFKKVEELKINRFIVLGLAIFFLCINFIPFETIFAPYGKVNILAHKIVYYFSASSISYASMALRCVYLMLFAFVIYSAKINVFKRGNEIYLLYLLGLVMYFMVCKFSILSRVTVYFEIFEIYVFAYFFIYQKISKIKFAKVFACVYLMLAGALFVKDGIATQQQSRYRDVSLICPYFTYLNN